MSSDSESRGLERPDWLPARASIVVTGRNNASARGEARTGKRPLAQLTWSLEGRLLYEKPLDPSGRAHGIETERDDAGRVIWCARWVHGLMHGPAIQFDAQGRPIVVTEFVRGRGVDIWVSCGKVTEVREMAEGVPHGLVRWGNPARPWEEEHFFHGQRHGVFRQWEPDGSLRKGYPHFYLRDTRVSRRKYEAARAKDESLPEYRATDDSNRRTIPQVVREALERARRLASELALLEHARSAKVKRE